MAWANVTRMDGAQRQRTSAPPPRRPSLSHRTTPCSLPFACLKSYNISFAARLVVFSARRALTNCSRSTCEHDAGCRSNSYDHRARATRTSELSRTHAREGGKRVIPLARSSLPSNSMNNNNLARLLAMLPINQPTPLHSSASERRRICGGKSRPIHILSSSYLII